MNADDYFNRHLPHRVNLLTTFRERYGPKPASNPSRPKLECEQTRDLFRCCKDIAMLMVRFFCDEMGLHLPKGGSQLKENSKWHHPFKALRFTDAEAIADLRYRKLLDVVKAANRAVAHIEPVDVDHAIKTDKEHLELVEVIDWIEELIRTHMYEPNGRSLEEAMRLPDNVMVASSPQRGLADAESGK